MNIQNFWFNLLCKLASPVTVPLVFALAILSVCEDQKVHRQRGCLAVWFELELKV